jgi:hypothetical protein
MATDPIRRIREREYELPLTFGVRDALSALAQLPPQSGKQQRPWNV